MRSNSRGSRRAMRAGCAPPAGSRARASACLRNSSSIAAKPSWRADLGVPVEETPRSRRAPRGPRSMRSRMPGRWTFTATRARRAARAMHLAQRGRRKRLRIELGERLEMRTPSSSETMRSTSSYGNGATWSWSRESASTYGAGSRSPRVERNWPSLMNVGPIASRSSASCFAIARAASSSSVFFCSGPPFDSRASHWRRRISPGSGCTFAGTASAFRDPPSPARPRGIRARRSAARRGARTCRGGARSAGTARGAPS